MNPDEATVLCGEWNTGATQPKFSEEKYNVALEITKIVRHPDFKPQLGVEGGNDLAIFKVKRGELEKSQTEGIEINPICLPEPNRPQAKKGVSSGWGNPPPLQYFKEFGEGYLSFVTDSFKQWHYMMDIYKECKTEDRICFAPNTKIGECPMANLIQKALPEKYVATPHKYYYPPGLVCAREVSKRFCPTAGDSGSPLMVRQGNRYKIILIYLCVCVCLILHVSAKLHVSVLITNMLLPMFSLQVLHRGLPELPQGLPRVPNGFNKQAKDQIWIPTAR